MNNIDMLLDQLITKETPTIVQISTAKLHPFPAHPFKVQDDEDMEQLTQSIHAQGVLTPLVIRPLKNGEYEIISGHRRLHACRKAGIQTVPALVYAIDRNAAAIALVDSNLHRERILPSEKAFAYKLKMDALSKQGKRTDLTSDQVGPKLTAATLSSEDRGNCETRHYIRADAIEQVVMWELQRMAAFLRSDEDVFAELLAQKTNADMIAEKKYMEAELQRCIARNNKVAELFEKLYEDNVEGKVTDEWFLQLSHKYEVERMELKEKIAALRGSISDLDSMQTNKDQFIHA